MKHYIIPEDRFRRLVEVLVGKKHSRDVLRAIETQVPVMQLRRGDKLLTARGLNAMINDVAEKVRA